MRFILLIFCCPLVCARNNIVVQHQPSHTPQQTSSEFISYEQHELGSSCLMRCNVTMKQIKEKGNITWYFNKKQIFSDPAKYVLEKEGLRIHRLDLRDKGVYICSHVSKEHLVSQVKQIHLDILYPPVILRHPSSEPAIKGKNLTLNCQAVGNPPVHYEWLKEKMITEIIRAKVRIAENVETLVIPNFDQSDEGRYFCKTSNSLGFKENYADIQMLVPPKISLSIANASLLENSTLNIICATTGVPIPKITWSMVTLNNSTSKELKLDSIHERSQPGVSTVVIHRLTRTHAGNLTCKASNVAGSSFSTAHIMVEFKPEIQVEIAENPDLAQETFSALCRGTGFPLPEIVWLQNNKVLNEHNSFYRITHIIESATNISTYLNVSDYSSHKNALKNITCLAKNVHGNFSTQLEIPETDEDYNAYSIEIDAEIEEITLKEDLNIEHVTKFVKVMEKQITEEELSSGVRFVIIVSIGCAFVIGLIITAVLAACFIQKEKRKKSLHIDSVFLTLQKPVIVSKNSPTTSPPSKVVAAKNGDENDSLTKKSVAVKLIKKSPVSMSTREKIDSNLNGYYKGDSVDDVIDQFASVSSDKLTEL